MTSGSSLQYNPVSEGSQSSASVLLSYGYQSFRHFLHCRNGLVSKPTQIRSPSHSPWSCESQHIVPTFVR